VLPPRNFLKTYMQNSAFSSKIFTCFKMHPVNNEGGASPPPPRPWIRHWHQSSFCFSQRDSQNELALMAWLPNTREQSPVSVLIRQN